MMFDLLLAFGPARLHSASSVVVKAYTKKFTREGRELSGIGFMVSIRPGDDVEAEFDSMIESICQCHSRHGEDCGELVVGFVAEPSDLETIRARFLLLIQREGPLRPLFVRLGRVETVFTTPDGKTQEEVTFRTSD